MPRKRKISDNDNMADGALTGNGSTAQSAKSTPKKKTTPRPKAAGKKAVPAKSASPEITDEAIRVRAYHIAEERVRRGLPGDENSDWLEARRQLMAELG